MHTHTSGTMYICTNIREGGSGGGGGGGAEAHSSNS